MIDIELLKHLADGKFHSGTALGEALGLGRSAVWKQMQALQELGVDVYSVRGRGYRLPGGLDLLDISEIEAHMSAQVRATLRHIELDTFTDSTNLMALRNIQNVRHGGLYLAEHQRAGKGRRGRRWVSPFASNIYTSLIWRFSGGAASLEGLSLVVGLSIVQALKKLGVNGLSLKWPNDILHSGRKVAGILLEMQGEASGEVSVVIGVGINVNMGQREEPAIDQPWIDLQRVCDKKLSRNQLVAKVLECLITNLERFSVRGFSEFIEPWQALHAYQDDYVKLINGEQVIEGICRGVAKSGAIVLERYGRLEPYHGGEISMRPL